MSAGSIVIDLLMKTGSFETDSKRAEKRLQDMRKQASQVGAALGTALAVGALAAAAGLTAVVNVQRGLIDDQAKLAQRLNTSYTSLANLGRAGELAGVGMSQIEASSRQLDLSIGKAIQGTKAQAEAFKRLGIDARALADLPLDKRIELINKALRDNVPLAERSAVAAELFGAKNAAAMQALDPATIAEAARQVEIFGLNLSDVDAAKVEQANDAMSTFGMLADGIGKQLTVELAPILKAIGDEFLRSAEEAGGLGTVVQDMVGKAVNGLSFVIDAGDGVRRVFQVIGRVGAVSILGLERAVLGLADSIISGPTYAVNELIRVLNHLPGVEIAPVGLTSLGASIRSQMRLVESAIAEGASDIVDTVMAPLAGAAVRNAYAAAQLAGQAAAELAVQGRRSGEETSAAFSRAETQARKVVRAARDSSAAVQSQIDALQVQAATLGMTSQAATLYKLSLDGASESQLRTAATALEMIASFERAEEQASRLAAMLAATPTAELQRARDDMLLLEEAFLRGKISAEEFTEAAQARLGTLPDTIKQSTDAMTVFADQAARNMQDAFAQFLFDPFDGGVRGMVSSFVTAIHKMASELLASQLLNMLGGAMAGSGGFLGAFGTALKGISGARADGGPVWPGGTFLVGERGPELFKPNTAGSVLPNHAMGSGEGSGGMNLNLRQTLVFDPEQIGDWLGSDSGEKHLRTFVQRNAGFMRQTIGA